MSLREFLNTHEWDGNTAATQEAISALVAWSPVPLPADYLELLGCSDGGHATLSGNPEYVRFWPATTVIEYNQDYEMQRWLPGLMGFGDDGGPSFFALDTRDGQPFPILAFSFVPMEMEQAVLIAEDFGQLLRRIRPKSHRDHAV